MINYRPRSPTGRSGLPKEIECPRNAHSLLPPVVLAQRLPALALDALPQLQPAQQLPPQVRALKRGDVLPAPAAAGAGVRVDGHEDQTSISWPAKRKVTPSIARIRTVSMPASLN